MILDPKKLSRLFRSLNVQGQCQLWSPDYSNGDAVPGPLMGQLLKGQSKFTTYPGPSTFGFEDKCITKEREVFLLCFVFKCALTNSKQDFKLLLLNLLNIVFKSFLNIALAFFGLGLGTLFFRLV